MYAFDSKRVQCLGLIQDLVVTSHQIPVKIVVIDIVVTDIPPKFGMLLSRSCCEKLGGSVQMDMSFSTIHVYGGQSLRLYREVRFINTVCNDNKARNYPISAVDQEFSCFQLSLDTSQNSQLKIEDVVDTSKPVHTEIWKLFFDGAGA